MANTKKDNKEFTKKNSESKKRKLEPYVRSKVKQMR